MVMRANSKRSAVDETPASVLLAIATSPEAFEEACEEFVSRREAAEVAEARAVKERSSADKALALLDERQAEVEHVKGLVVQLRRLKDEFFQMKEISYA